MGVVILYFLGAFNWWGQLVIREYKKNSLIFKLSPCV